MKHFLLINLFAISISLSAADYKSTALGVQLSYPDNFIMDTKQSQNKSQVITFEYGKPPFSSKIQIKKHRHDLSFSECLTKEREGQKSGGYLNEMSENRHHLKSGLEALEFIRKTKFGKVHQIIISTSRKNYLLELWYMSGQAVDDKIMTKALYEILNSIREI